MEEALRLEGSVESLIFENRETGYTVFELSGGGELFVVCGTVGEIHIGETVSCMGNFETHATYGKQFHAITCESDMPKDEHGIFSYLSSGALPYIGVATAKKIMSLFGLEALEIIANEPQKLTTIKGITTEKARRINKEFHRMFGVREIIGYLARFGISATRAVLVFQEYGAASIEAINANPYLLVGEPLNLSFQEADKIAAELQFAVDSNLRRSAVLQYSLRHNANNGHTCVPRARLLATTAKFIQLPLQTLEETLEECLREGELMMRLEGDQEYIYLPDLYRAEEDVALRLADLMKYDAPRPNGLVSEVIALELAQGFAYAENQHEAICGALEHNCFVLTGGPGTGKSTTVDAIIRLLEAQGQRVLLCAPTGRAAKRLSELTQHKVSTIHRTLEVNYNGKVLQFVHNEKNLLKCDVIILDEMSMVDVKLFQSLLSALKRGCRVIMVGDADQLPSVGAGNILGDILRAGVVPSVCLTKIFRQAQESLIVTNAHRIVEGQGFEKASQADDFFFIESRGEACQQLICDLVANRLPARYGLDAIRDIQVLCPTKMGFSGTQALNLALQQQLNPPMRGKAELQVGNNTFRVGDKVMQVRNNYEIEWYRPGSESGVGAYNGDIGIILEIHPHQRAVKVQMDDRVLVYAAENLIELEIAYAITIHKSQGSEFAAVVLPAAEVPARLCYRNLIYTGITRARNLCVVVGQRSTVNGMIQNTSQNKRFSGLAPMLIEAYQDSMQYQGAAAEKAAQEAQELQAAIASLKEE
ncbi:MAG: ATP-dependent RecD-like DNA helicase [Faecalibacterium sp.]